MPIHIFTWMVQVFSFLFPACPGRIVYKSAYLHLSSPPPFPLSVHSQPPLYSRNQWYTTSSPLSLTLTFHWFLTALWLGFYTLFICSNHLSHLCLKPLVFLVGVQPTFNTNILQLSSSALFPPSVLGNPLLLTPLHCALIFKLRKMYLPSFFFS